MYHQIFILNSISFVLIKNTLLDMTINNPIFIFALITVIWFIPGIIVRRLNEIKLINKKKKNQSDAIKKLFILRLTPNLKIAGTLVTNSVVFFGTKKDVSTKNIDSILSIIGVNEDKR